MGPRATRSSSPSTSPTAGLAAAVEAPRAIETHEWPDGLRLRVRMGVHVGEVEEHDNDLVGMSINHAARIAAAAHGGQIVVSDAVREMVRELSESVDIRPLGTHRLRDVGAIALFQVHHPDLQHDFPPPRGVLGYRTNLPHNRTPFIGGEELLEAVAEQFRAGNLVTLTGTGGVGKTRAAIEFGHRHLDDFDQGVFFVDLAPVSDTGAVVGAVASLHSDPSATPALRQQLSDMAARVQSPLLSTFAHQYDGHACLMDSPPNFAGAMTAYGRMTEFAQATGDVQSQAGALRGLAMASTGLGSADALARCRDALEFNFEIRYWQKTWQTLESVALTLANAGRTEHAAVILGHVEAHSPDFGLEHGLHFRDRVRELVDADGGHTAAKQCGAQMSPEDLVTNALAYCSADSTGLQQSI